MLVAKTSPKALVVDDTVSIAQVVGNTLGLLDFDVRLLHDPLEALAVCQREYFALIMLDIRMPGMDGIELLTRLKVLNPSATYVMMTAENQDNLQVVIQALRAGAQGFVLKPFHINELISSVELALEKTRLLRTTIRTRLYAPLLEGATAALLSALELKDTSTQNHSNRVSYYAQKISDAYRTELSYEDLVQIRLGALFHDVGKIGVPDHILKKAGPLTPEERQEIMKHPEIGAKIIGAVEGMEKVAAIVRAHHERFDGRGYPDKLSGYDIPFGARIATVADCFEAMVSPRVYSPGHTVEYALSEIKRCRGSQFDPEITDIFLAKIENGDIIHQPADALEGPPLGFTLTTAQKCNDPVVPQPA